MLLHANAIFLFILFFCLPVCLCACLFVFQEFALLFHSHFQKTELGLGDKYLLLAVIYMLDQWYARKNEFKFVVFFSFYSLLVVHFCTCIFCVLIFRQSDASSVCLFEVIYLLEVFYRNSPANYYPKLILMRLYSYLSAIHRYPRCFCCFCCCCCFCY
jgi:hypothetical protein